ATIIPNVNKPHACSELRWDYCNNKSSYFGSCYPRDLHSFPTRRSSDLAGAALGHAPAVMPAHRRRSRQCRRLAQQPPHQAHRIRSEEHTSELQSLAYLVCRLLLEKKKKYKASYMY